MCRSRRELSNEYLLAKIGVDTAENEPLEVWGENSIQYSLHSLGFTARNTLFAHSVCSDEVNHKDEQLVDLMVSRWGEGFELGGLAGVPFAGKSGFRAYLYVFSNFYSNFWLSFGKI